MPALSNEPSGIEGFRALGLTDLLELRDAAQRRIDEHLNDAGFCALKEALADANAVLREKLTPLAMHTFSTKAKSSGDVTVEGAGYKAKASISKKVEWDQAKLRNVASGLTWAQAQKLFKIEFSVPEAIYKAVIDDKLKASLDDARTTRLGDLKISVERA